ncbi:MAG TPA: hypothetical protein VJB94_03255 [Candidatus Nanoarchaeia archaeon]|nr:hypothetical protein [Candidatus Nanoarchaeia archaeon]
MIWTKEEIGSYTPIESKKLVELYEGLGINKYDPEKRAEFLAEKLQLTMTDHDVIMRTAAEKGKPAALNLLEEMVLAEPKKGSETGSIPVVA